jgi:BirA family biotin operon repressor/biotin-[acetyl-CoA-carboxylase] ligase
MNEATPGAPIHRHQSLDSTNTELLRLADAGAPHHTAVVAKFQTAGRGQPGRSWWMPPGKGILLSILYRELPAGVEFSGLTVHLGRRMAELIQFHVGRKVDIKLPNDLLIDGRKVAGILCEARWRGDRLLHIVAGFGLNVNVLEFPDDLAASATSLAREAGREFDLEFLTDAVIQRLRDL